MCRALAGDSVGCVLAARLLGRAARIRNAAAFLGATSAGLSALLAVLHAVLPAFSAARVAHLRAYRTNRRCELATPRHETGSQSADLGTIDIERNASRHGLGIRFQAACGGTVIACGRALIARFNTSGELLVSHKSSSKKKKIEDYENVIFAGNCRRCLETDSREAFQVSRDRRTFAEIGCA